MAEHVDGFEQFKDVLTLPTVLSVTGMAVVPLEVEGDETHFKGQVVDAQPKLVIDKANWVGSRPSIWVCATTRPTLKTS